MTGDSAFVSSQVSQLPSRLRIEAAHVEDITALSELNNHFSPQGLTLPRAESWVSSHIDDYRVVRDDHGRVLGCVCLDDYSPSLVELVSLAVRPEHQGKGMGSALIGAAVDLALRRGYPELFAVSFSDNLFQNCGFHFGDINRYPEKRARYAKVSDDEWTVGQKHCFVMDLRPLSQPAAGEG